MNAVVLVVGVVGAISGLVAAITGRQQSRQDGMSKSMDALDVLNDALRERIRDLEEENKRLRGDK